MIHVCFGLYDATGKYSKFTGTTICSLFENHTPPLLPSITVHILHDNTLSDENREKFIYLAGRYGQLVKFYNVEELCADKLAEIRRLLPTAENSRYSIAAFYRLFIPNVIPQGIGKCIYLDSDLIVNLDISELWRVELGNNPLAVIPEILNYESEAEILHWFCMCREGLVKTDDYFNSGVMLMNLEVLREADEQITQGIQFVSKDTRYQFFAEQDILNYIFSSQALKLPVKYDKFVWLTNVRGNHVAGRNIYHYTPPQAFGLDINVPLNRLWMDYFLKTP